MGMNWTEDQKKVISLRNRNILVSAAAGSGKTAVLVQRILEKILDKKNPIDIDRLLIMTFTRAAAGEMRERIARALEKALYEDPDNEHLQRQVTIIHTAQITTIDGFCAYIIRNYFHLIGIDPGYRVADEGELKLLKGDVLEALLEEKYAQKEKEFENFIECYASDKTDEGIKDQILKLYEAAMSHPYPFEWLENYKKSYKIDENKSFYDTEWIKLLWEYTKQDLESIKQIITKMIKICREAEGPYLYEEAVAQDAGICQELMKATEEQSFDKMHSLLANLSYATLSRKKMQDVDPRKRERVKELRDSMKKMLKDLKERYFPYEEAQLMEMIQESGRPIAVLIDLTIAFAESFAAAKREENLLDFVDMEHMALDILLEKKDGEYQMTQAAKELSEKYDEVMIDEYQDTNYVQELLTKCVSGWSGNRKNTFMVGDVKQSIYRFRQACPELFMMKYKTYTVEESGYQKIDLHKNFRSRAQVLESVNYIFRQIMTEDLGGIAYDDAAALYPGAVFPEGEDEEFVKTEILLVEKDGEDEEGADDEAAEMSAREREALAISHKIKEIVGIQKIVDKETGEYRPVEYGDIVILLQTAAGWAEDFMKVFSSQGIPAYTISKTGYFSALEVVTLLNYLKICDNPRQDIALAGILKSPIVGCTTQELALLKIHSKKNVLYECIREYILLGQEGVFEEESEKLELLQKLLHFTQQLESFRDMSAYTPVHQMILRILRETGYGNYVKAMPDGVQRSANLAMLVEKALDYEKTSYRGVFNFIRYIEHLHKYDIDYGEVNVAGAGNGAVQIMTIHKSKGLEFPIVFAAGMGKHFNLQDMNAKILIHPELGIGADVILPEKRIIAASLMKQIIRRKLMMETLGEELRVLYVAMTRAKEKLILTGTEVKFEKLFQKLEGLRQEEGLTISLGTKLKAVSFWDFILPALVRHHCMDEWMKEYDIFTPSVKGLKDEQAEFKVDLITTAKLAEDTVISSAESMILQDMLENWDADKVYDPDLRKQIQERFEFVYPFSYLRELPIKVSVSDLKKRSYLDMQEKEENILQDTKVEIEEIVPAFMREKEEHFLKGSARGTAYHCVMEWLDYAKTEDDAQLKEQILLLQKQQKLSEEEKNCIKVRDIRKFLDSPIGSRMKAAAQEGRLYREQPFVIARPANELKEEWQCQENVLIQGIIDAYFYEDEEIILVDYKTDKVRKGQEQKLIDLYHIQLEDYAHALERMTKKKVKEIYIYSFTLHKEIPL